jgi:hypothetical protein
MTLLHWNAFWIGYVLNKTIIAYCRKWPFLLNKTSKEIKDSKEVKI